MLLSNRIIVNNNHIDAIIPGLHRSIVRLVITFECALVGISHRDLTIEPAKLVQFWLWPVADHWSLPCFIFVLVYQVLELALCECDILIFVLGLRLSSGHHIGGRGLGLIISNLLLTEEMLFL